MDSIATNVPVLEVGQAILLGDLAPTSPVFTIIDCVLALMVLLLMPLLLRASLRLFAQHEADDSLFKSFVTMQAILAMVATVAISLLSPWAKGAAALGVFLCSALLLRVLCWITPKKALVVMAALTLAGGGLGAGLVWLSNYLLPSNRVTLLDHVRKSLGVIEEFAGQAASTDAVFTSNTLHNIKMGLILETEALAGAVYLLRNPSAIEEMTADHTADLKALDLITDGKMPSPEELKELGITEEEITAGRDALQRARNEEAVSEQDVRELARFMKSVRKDDAPLTANDIAFVVQEAKKRAGPRMAELLAAAQSGGTGSLHDASRLLAGTGTNDLTNALDQASATNLSHVAATLLPPVPVDPLAAMSRDERGLWLDSQRMLHLGGLVKKSGETFALVNGFMVRTGEIVWVEMDGRSFAWRLLSAKDYRATWEAVPQGEKPVVPAPAPMSVTTPEAAEARAIP